MRLEEHTPTPAMIRHRVPSDTSTPVSAVEAWLDQFPQKRAENKPNGGIIRSIADTSELCLREMSPRERKAAIAKAQREHRQALKNLAKQEAQDTKKIAKQLVKWRKEGKVSKTQTTKIAKKVAKPTKRVAKARKPKAKKHVKPKLTKSFQQLRKARLESRLKAMLKTLNSGDSIKMVPEKEGKESGSPYYLQRKDIVRLSDRAGEDIIRIKDISKDVSYFMFDRYPRYHTDKLIDMHEPKALLRALMSGKLVSVSDVKQKTTYVSKHVVNLARQYSFNIFAVYSTRYLIGWILLEDESKEAVYKEFETIAAGIGATVKQVVAAGNGQ